MAVQGVQAMVVMNAMDAVNNLLNLKFDEFDLKLKDYAKENNVPIIFDDGLAFLETIIRLYKPKRIFRNRNGYCLLCNSYA